MSPSSKQTRSMKTSSLNPLANSFVPSKVQAPSEMVSLGKISFKSLANKYLQDLIENKKKKNESAITREEISAIVMRLIDYGDRKSQKYDPVILRGYLKSKVPEALSIKPLVAPKVEEKKLPSSDVKIKGFDLSAFKAPKGSILLVSLWGLYRQEQALRPMISMTHRPEPMEDRVWSVTPNDFRVWNARAVEKPCHCPPMFGYSVPPAVFGNPLKINFPCNIGTPHLNRYGTTSEGDEMALVPSERHAVLCSGDVFKEPEDSGSVKGSLDFYLQEFKMIVNSVCKIISEEERKEMDCTGFLPEFDACDHVRELWDSDVTANRPKADEIMEDDNCHPLLDRFPTLEEETENEGVATNIKELIRRSCSSETTDSGIAEDCCDPPCSHWCHSSPKCTNSTREALDILNDTTVFLLNFGSNDSAPTHRPNFKRSFSANDCDAYLEKMKFAPPASMKDSLPFLQKDPLNFLRKLKDPCDSWKDSDSGILSNCSSQDDFRDYGFEEGEEYLADVDMAPMWSLFSGDGSLWQPLPSPNQEECIKFPHKRVKELRRLQSMT